MLTHVEDITYNSDGDDGLILELFEDKRSLLIEENEVLMPQAAPMVEAEREPEITNTTAATVLNNADTSNMLIT